MLVNFFQLDDEKNARPIPDLDALREHFRHADSLENAVLAAAVYHRAPKEVFASKRFRNVRFSKSQFKEITFNDCIFEDCLFVGTTFEECEFIRCKFINCNTYKFKLKDVYLDPTSFKLNPEYQQTHANVGVGLFQILYRNSAQTSQDRFEATADIAFRRWRRAQLRYEKLKGWITAWEFAREYYPNSFDDCLSVYGYSPTRFILTSVAGLFALSLISFFAWDVLGLMRGSIPIENPSLLDMFYFCMLIFSTLGFSDVIATTTAGKLFVIFCSVIGILWVAALAAILVRRFFR